MRNDSETGSEPRLFLLAAPSTFELGERVEELRARAGEDPAALAGELWRSLDSAAAVRCAAVASGAEELERRLDALASLLAEPAEAPVRGGRGAFAGTGEARIGFMFPGQGAPVHSGAGALAGPLPEAAEVYARAGLPAEREQIADDCVQLAVVASSLAALTALEALGIEAELAVGHSLGELTALHWAGALDREALLGTAAARGRAMVHHTEGGAMATVIADEETFAGLVAGAEVVVACHNSPRQRAISGAVAEIEPIVSRARGAGARAVRLRVTGAFHSPLMESAVPVFEEHLSGVSFGSPRRCVLSTVTGGELSPDEDLRGLVSRQLTAPVRFAEAAAEAARRCDVLIEVGPGRALAGLAAETADTPVCSVRAGDSSAAGLMEVAAAAFAAGRATRLERLFDARPAAAATA